MEANVGDRSVGAESGRTCRHREPVLRQCYCNSNHTNTVISKGCHIPTELTAQYSSPFLGFVAVKLLRYVMNGQRVQNLIVLSHRVFICQLSLKF